MKIIRLLLLLLTAGVLGSCLKNKESELLDYRGIEPVVLNPKSNFPSKSTFAVKLADSAFGITKLNLTAKYSFQLPAPRDIKVVFSRDEAAMNKYNQTFFSNYLPLPADAYELPAGETLILKGTQLGTFPVKIIPSKISGNNNYIIAFTITGAADIGIAENFKSMVYTLKGK
jgi:hypothetical protein